MGVDDFKKKLLSDNVLIQRQLEDESIELIKNDNKIKKTYNAKEEQASRGLRDRALEARKISSDISSNITNYNLNKEQRNTAIQQDNAYRKFNNRQSKISSIGESASSLVKIGTQINDIIDNGKVDEAHKKRKDLIRSFSKETANMSSAQKATWSKESNYKEQLEKVRSTLTGISFKSPSVKRAISNFEEADKSYYHKQSLGILKQKSKEDKVRVGRAINSVSNTVSSNPYSSNNTVGSAFNKGVIDIERITGQKINVATSDALKASIVKSKVSGFLQKGDTESAEAFLGTESANKFLSPSETNKFRNYITKLKKGTTKDPYKSTNEIGSAMVKEPSYFTEYLQSLARSSSSGSGVVKNIVKTLNANSKRGKLSFSNIQKRNILENFSKTGDFKQVAKIRSALDAFNNHYDNDPVGLRDIIDPESSSIRNSSINQALDGRTMSNEKLMDHAKDILKVNSSSDFANLRDNIVEKHGKMSDLVNLQALESYEKENREMTSPEQVRFTAIKSALNGGKTGARLLDEAIQASKVVLPKIVGSSIAESKGSLVLRKRGEIDTLDTIRNIARYRALNSDAKDQEKLFDNFKKEFVNITEQYVGGDDEKNFIQYEDIGLGGSDLYIPSGILNHKTEEERSVIKEFLEPEALAKYLTDDPSIDEMSKSMMFQKDSHIELRNVGGTKYEFLSVSNNDTGNLYHKVTNHDGSPKVIDIGDITDVESKDFGFFSTTKPLLLNPDKDDNRPYIHKDAVDKAREEENLNKQKTKDNYDNLGVNIDTDYKGSDYNAISSTYGKALSASSLSVALDNSHLERILDDTITGTLEKPGQGSAMGNTAKDRGALSFAMQVIAGVESNFIGTAVSKAGAKGSFQIIDKNNPSGLDLSNNKNSAKLGVKIFNQNLRSGKNILDNIVNLDFDSNIPKNITEKARKGYIDDSFWIQKNIHRVTKGHLYQLATMRYNGGGSFNVRTLRKLIQGRRSGTKYSNDSETTNYVAQFSRVFGIGSKEIQEFTSRSSSKNRALNIRVNKFKSLFKNKSQYRSIVEYFNSPYIGK